jgi:CheY-like chemotaxis protein
MSQKTAVVIDDEVDLTAYMSAILEENGFSVHVANEATTGEALIREKMPDIVLLDLMMPGRTGIQLFSRIRRDPSTKKIPLVMVTGIKEKLGIDWGEIVDQMKVRRPDGFVEKPIEPDRLMSVVRGVLSGAGDDDEVLHG